jgi:outer membrane receptor protein involved in Fe transport
VAPTADGTVQVNGQAIPVGTIQSIAPNFANQHDFIVNADASLENTNCADGFSTTGSVHQTPTLRNRKNSFSERTVPTRRKVIFTDAWSISNNVINDFRTSYSRLNGPNLVVPSGFVNFPNVEVDELGSNLGPNGLAPQGYAQNVYQWVDNISYIRGKHALKFGVEVRKFISPTNTLPRARGEWDYASLSQFINDFVPTGANGALRGAGSGSVAENYNAFYWFVQDDWKVTPRLTLNLGLRYEYSGVPRDENLQAINGVSDDPALGLIFRAETRYQQLCTRVGLRGIRVALEMGGSRRRRPCDVVPNAAINSLPPQLQSDRTQA